MRAPDDDRAHDHGEGPRTDEVRLTTTTWSTRPGGLAEDPAPPGEDAGDGAAPWRRVHVVTVVDDPADHGPVGHERAYGVRP